MGDEEIEKRILEALHKLEEQEPGGAVVFFTATQAEALIEVAKWWIAFRGAGKVGAAMGSAVKWLALMIGAWIAFKAGILDWIAQSLGDSK